MKAPCLLLVGALLIAAGPVLAAPAADWTKKSPIKVVPGWIPDEEGTIVHMVPGTSSGPKAPAAPVVAKAPAKVADCACPSDPGVVKFRP